MPVQTVPPDNAPAVSTAGLTKRYGTLTAVDDLTLTVEAGEVFGFLGPNGAGKSTTIRLLLGLARPTRGTASVFGIPAAEVEQAHRWLAYVPADVSLWPGLTGMEILELLARLGPGTDVAYRSSLVERFDLAPDRPARTYSTGNRQKVALVAAFATRAPLLVLDEPTSGLDPLMEGEFQRCVHEASARGQTVFLSSHQLTEVDQLCTRVGILRAGRLVEIAMLNELRRLRRSEVRLTFSGAARVPAGLADVPGVGSVRRPAPHQVVLSLAGPPAALLRALADADVTSIDVREPSLEEIFGDYYGEVST